MPQARVRGGLGGLLVASQSLPGVIGAQLGLVASGVLLPHLLVPADRGQVGIVLAAVATSAYFALLGQPTAVLIAARAHRSVPADLLARAIINALKRAVVLCIAVAFGLYVSGLATNVTLLTLAVAGAVAFVVVPFSAADLYAADQPRVAGILEAAPTVAWAIGVLGLWLVLGTASIVQIAVAWFVCRLAVVGSALLVLHVRRRHTERVSASVPSQHDRIGTGSFALLSPFEVVNPELYAPSLLIGPAASGIYIVAEAFLTLPRMVGTRLVPQVLSNGRNRLSTNRALLLVTAAGLGTAVLGYILVPIIFPPEYVAAQQLVPILAVAAVLGSLRRVTAATLVARGLTASPALAEIICWAMFAFLLLAGTLSSLGMVEVAAAYLIAAGVAAVAQAALQRVPRVAAMSAAR
jgi:hypothetical protein